MLLAVVPTLDEAAALPSLLAALAPEVDRVVVADGGSTDGTPELARAAGVEVVHAPRGRGPQLRAGALPGADRYWFVHADTGLPPGAGAALRRAGPAWGCFATRVDSDDPRLRLCGAWMTARARLTGSCTGDMGMWMDADLYRRLGGFAPLVAFEDLDLSDRARRVARWSVLTPPLSTSARRWRARGVTRTTLRMWSLRAAYRLGVDPAALARRY